MPELPEVETVRRGLVPVLEGRRLAAATVRRPDLRFPLPENLASRLAGRCVQRLDRRGKYLLLRLDDGWTLLCHLGMSGGFAVTDAWTTEPGPHDHVDLVTEDGACLRYRDPRRFGFMDLIAPDGDGAHPRLKDLGPEPLSNGFSGPYLAARLDGRRGPVKAALLDQKLVAGLGNIYVCEALFRAGLSPRRRAGTVTGGRAETLVRAVRDVLEAAIAAGGSSLRDHRKPDGDLGYFQHTFAVYDREGRPCPGCTCADGVHRIVQSGRSTFYCATRQR